jgi:hypothetical protein
MKVIARQNQGKLINYEDAASSRASLFLLKYEFLIPLILFVIFLSVTLPGISWGAPSTWHPDEVVVRSIKALHGEWKFDEINFDYPSLPQYAMFWLGKAILALGQTDKEVLIDSRILSAVLAGLTIVLTYIIARRAGGSIYIAGLSGLLLLCVSEMTHNGHFAHNDTYVTFFTTLTVLFLVEYFNRSHKIWLYAAFVTVGMAASSKYIGGILLIVPVSIYLMLQRKNLRNNLFAIAETLFVGGALTFLGYAAGTPKSLLWMSYYFKRVYAALRWQVTYGRQPDSIRGIFGQYQVLADGLGIALFLLFGAALLWTGYQILRAYRSGAAKQNSRISIFAILLLAIFVLDLPMLISYNYQLRYFLTLMPLLAVLAAFFIEDIYIRARQSKSFISPMLVTAGVTFIILFSLARVASVMLLFVNDARIPASEYLKTLPTGTSLEHTLYPPTIPPGHFEREHNYPIHFIKTMGGAVPVSRKYVFNAGEPGLDERMTDYLVIDNFTWGRFDDPFICESMPAECEFFKQLGTGQSSHYRLIAEFTYTLPPYLPRVNIAFVNPGIRIYERIQ